MRVCLGGMQQVPTVDRCLLAPISLDFARSDNITRMLDLVENTSR